MNQERFNTYETLIFLEMSDTVSTDWTVSNWSGTQTQLVTLIYLYISGGIPQEQHNPELYEKILQNYFMGNATIY